MRIYKFKVGEEIPEEAIYLTTLIETAPYIEDMRCVWHYFLIKEKKEELKNEL